MPNPPGFMPFGEWLPDQPDYNNPGASTIKNVIPGPNGTYFQLPTPAVWSSNALTARCQGVFPLRPAKTGGVNLFAGDANRLYRVVGTSLNDVSKSAGGPYSTGSPLTPAWPTLPAWRFTAFGDRVIATNYVDNVQTFNFATSDTAFSDLAGSPPKARYCAVIKDFLMLANTNDGTSGVQTRRLWWPAIGNPTSWPTPGSAAAIQVQSDYQDLEQTDLGDITGIVGGHLASADGAAFCERGVYTIQYVGSSGGIFAFQVAQGAAGCIAPSSIIPGRLVTGVGERAVVFYLGLDDFYAFDGMFSIPLAYQKIFQFFLGDASPTYLSAVQGTADPDYTLVFWLYVSNAGAAAGLYDRALIFNTTLQRWSYVDLTSIPQEWAFQAIQITGVPILGTFDNAHKLNTLNGSAMAPTVETSEVQPFPGRGARIISARPIFDGGSSATLQLGHRDRIQDSVTYDTAVSVNANGECPMHQTGNYVRFRFALPSGQTFSHLSGVQLTAKPDKRLSR